MAAGTYSLELEMKLQNPLPMSALGNPRICMAYLIESTLETPFSLGAVVPFFINDSKCNVLVRWPGHEPNEASILLSSCGERLATFPSMLSLYTISRRLCFIDKVRVEYVEFIALDNLRRWVIMVVMGLVVFVPLVAHLDAVEIPWLARSILICPLGSRTGADSFFAGENLLVLTNASGEFPFVEGGSGLREVLIRDGGETA